MFCGWDAERRNIDWLLKINKKQIPPNASEYASLWVEQSYVAQKALQIKILI